MKSVSYLIIFLNEVKISLEHLFDTRGLTYFGVRLKIRYTVSKEKAVNKYQNILARICRIAIPGHRIELGAEQIQDRPSSFYE